MRSIQVKLKSDRGASLIFSLLAFMAAAVVSIIIVTSASTAILRIKDDHTAQQARLTLTSAAELLRDEMAGCISTVTVKKTSAGTKTDPVFKSEGSDLDEMVTKAISQVYTYGIESETSFSIHVLKNENELLEPVEVKMTFYKNENDALQANASFEMMNRGGDILYMTMTSGSTSTDSSETKNEIITTTCKTIIKWDPESAAITNVEYTEGQL